MFNPQMFDPALISFFKQAGEAFKQCVEAEMAGKMTRSLTKHCGSAVPPEKGNPAFVNRCLLYAAKAYAMAHIDEKVTWGGIKAIMAASGAWPPPPDLKSQGALFQSFVLGFLYGSELPLKRQQSIENMIPMASRIASAPEDFARSMGMDPQQLQKMAESAGQSSGGLGSLMNFFKTNKP